MVAGTNTATVDKSIEEIRKFLLQMGAKGFSFGSLEDKAYLTFSYQGKGVRLMLDVPQRPGKDATIAQLKKHEQARRKKWRQVLICIKSKFHCIQCEIETFEQAFMAHLLTKDGIIFSELALDHVAEISGKDLSKHIGFPRKKKAA